MAVICRTECTVVQGSKKLCGVVLAVVLVLICAGWSEASPQGCDPNIKRDLVAAGFPGSTVLDRPANGPICGEDSCCSSNLEQEILREDRIRLDVFLKDSISRLTSLIDVRAKKFDVFFRDMMNNSKIEFHNMFQRTYGKIYLQNSDVFADFFAELETYYRKGSLRLADTMESFFAILYQRMFRVINSQYEFDDKYLECVSEHMAEMKPFGDVPHKLSMQLKRSFVATRTYYKSLAMGAEVAKKMALLKTDEQCHRELTRMQHCGRCKGRQGAGTCANYCSTVLEGCLRTHVSFSNEWDNFVEALDKVADRLIGPFNIEMVVEPLNIKISEAIMNFQESGTEVSKKIYTKCGKPSLSRKKRKTTAANFQDPVEENPYIELQYEPMKMHHQGGNGGGGGHGGGHHKKKKTKKYEEEDSGPTLEKLIKEIKLKIRETRQFWTHLPYQFCNNGSVAAPPSENGNCWNGTSLGDYARPKNHQQQQQQKLQETAAPSTIVSENVYTLHVFADKLRKAHQGEEVEIPDDSDENLDGSGSGSGDGGFDDEDEERTNIHEITGNNDDNNNNKNRMNENTPVVVVGRDDDDDDEDLEISENGTPEMPNVVPNNVPREPHQPPSSSSEPPQVVRVEPNAASMTLPRALAQYLIPIVLVWFGGAITDLL